MNRQDRRRTKAEQDRQRRIREAGFLDVGEVALRFADHVLRDTGEAPHIIIGPVVWKLSDRDGRHWYFVVGSSAASGQFRIDCLTIAMDERTVAENTRAALMLTFLERKPVVMHDFDDELRMAKFFEAVFPCDKTRSIRANLERERAS